ncbi:hypothetical protein OG937_45260 [Streptomyces sp. NBC_00510]
MLFLDAGGQECFGGVGDAAWGQSGDGVAVVVAGGGPGVGDPGGSDCSRTARR